MGDLLLVAARELDAERDMWLWLSRRLGGWQVHGFIFWAWAAAPGGVLLYPSAWPENYKYK
jgi:hypothetical protein